MGNYFNWVYPEARPFRRTLGIKAARKTEPTAPGQPSRAFRSPFSGFFTDSSEALSPKVIFYNQRVLALRRINLCFSAEEISSEVPKKKSMRAGTPSLWASASGLPLNGVASDPAGLLY
ncbi:MAG: hypothetical protein ACI8UZ_000422 [Akkermansiaceae bacterium]